MEEKLFPQHKIVIIGDYGVGKTCLLKQAMNQTVPKVHNANTSADYVIKEVEVDGTKVNVKIWDTAGMERFDTLGPIYYKEVDCCVLVFDLTNKASFESLDKWKTEFILQSNKENAEEFPFVVVGTKADKVDERQVSKLEIEGWSKDNGNIPVFEINIFDHEKVEKVFQKITKACMHQPVDLTRSVRLRTNTQTLNSAQKSQDSRGNKCCSQ